MPLTEDDVLRLVAGVERRELRVWIESGWVRPARGEAGGEVFTEADCARVRLIQELRRDLQVHDEALPLVLSLLDQVYGLRRELRRLVSAIQAEPEPVRRSIVARLQRPRD